MNKKVLKIMFGVVCTVRFKALEELIFTIILNK